MEQLPNFEPGDIGFIDLDINGIHNNDFIKDVHDLILKPSCVHTFIVDNDIDFCIDFGYDKNEHRFTKNSTIERRRIKDMIKPNLRIGKYMFVTNIFKLRTLRNAKKYLQTPEKYHSLKYDLQNNNCHTFCYNCANTKNESYCIPEDESMIKALNIISSCIFNKWVLIGSYILLLIRIIPQK